jgi:RHS repeat-associated protein
LWCQGFDYDAAGRAQSSLMTIGGQNYVFGYTHRWVGLESMRYPSGRLASYGFDLAGRASSVTGYASGIQYAPHGAVSSLSLQNGVVQTTGYNSRLQPVSIAAGSLLTLGFGYGTTNNNGNVLSQTISVPGASATQNYTYDNLNRLSGASEGSTWSRTFGYDAYGNMWVDTNNGVAADSFTPRSGSWFNSSNRLVNGGLPIQYSDSGELLQIGGYAFTYDAESRLKTNTLNSSTTTYSYDGEGRRVKKALAGGATTTYVYDAMGRLAAEYGGTVDTGGTQYLTADHLGSTRLMTNASGGMVKRYDYLPFGEEIPAGIGFRTSALGYAADAFPLKFTGKPRDYESGLQLDFFGARYFGSAMGRFTSADPKMFPSAFGDPQSWNKYAYTRNNPLRYVDPNGEDWMDVVAGAMNASGSDFLFGAGRATGGNADFRVGQAVGDAVATVAGTAVALFGGTETVVTSPAAVTVVGAVIPAAGVAAAAYGTSAAVVAGGHLVAAAFASDATSSGRPYEGTPQNQDRMSKGKAPVGKDGKPVELHHEGQASEGSLEELTQGEHRGGENFKKNHPNTGQQPSQIDRSKFRQQREQYWKDKTRKPDEQ